MKQNIEETRDSDREERKPLGPNVTTGVPDENSIAAWDMQNVPERFEQE